MIKVKMKPIYQGKLDNFCAAYAVLNALKLVRNISTAQARVVLNEMFYHEAKNPEEWLKILNHETTYQSLVKRMLERWSSTYGYKTFCPFDPLDSQNFISKIKQNIFGKNAESTAQAEVDKDLLWDTLMKYTKERESTVVLRFCRFLPHQVGPIVDHWTTLIKITDDTMHFFDCSLEPSGWYTIPRQKLYVAPFGTLPPQSIGLAKGMTLSLDAEEFAIIPPENIHVLKIVKNPFGV